MSRPKDFVIPKPEPLISDGRQWMRGFDPLSPAMQNEQLRVDFSHITGLLPARAFKQFQPDPTLPLPLGMPNLLYSYIFDVPSGTPLSQFKPYQLLNALKDQLKLPSMTLTPQDARLQPESDFQVSLLGSDRDRLFEWFSQNREAVKQFLEGSGPLPDIKPQRGGALPLSVTLAAVGDAVAEPHSGLPRAALAGKPASRTT